MDHLPIFMNLEGQPALVVGGGHVAARKADLLASAGARMTVIAPHFSDALRRGADAGGWTCHARAFEASDLDGCELVIAATDDAEVNCQVYAAARARRLPVNVADQPALCSFILPAIVDRAPVTVAISTGGRSPVLARHVKAQLEQFLPARLGRLAHFFGALREQVASRLADLAARRRYWEALVDSDASDLAMAGRDGHAKQAAARLLETFAADAASPESRRGRVWLVGAGPGDPELLTLKAHRLLQTADVVLFDRLVPLGVLELCRREAERVYVGKRTGDHTLPQASISELLVRYAGEGKRVVRLKGGDPFVFGRGGEELEALVAADIDFEVVPGVSAANGCAAYAGIPLTHRDHAQGVSFWTGHTRKGELDLDWAAMTNTAQTQVIYMGAGNAPQIRERLMAHGMSPLMPVALVQAGTTDAQRVLGATLHTLAGAAAELDPGLPTLIIIGQVVTLRRDLAWFEGDPAAAGAVFPPHLSAADRRATSEAVA